MAKDNYISPSIEAVVLLPGERVLQDGSPVKADYYNSIDQLFFGGAIMIDDEFA